MTEATERTGAATNRSGTGWAPWTPAPLEALYLLAGSLLALHYAWLLDDAFVYFRYIDNLLFLDLGLVYNAGEYVEGFSSPFWTLLLISARAVGMDFWFAIRAIAFLAFLAFGLVLVRLNREMMPLREGRPATPIVNFPLAYLGVCYGVSTYMTSGVEAPLIVVLSACYALFVLRPGSLGLQAVLGVSPLVRPELLVPLGVALLWAWARERRLPWCLIAVAGVANASWIAFRIYYYADLLPNTFYLKDTVDFSQGMAYLRNTVVPYQLLPVALAGLAAVAVLSRKPADEDGADDLMLAQRAAMLLIALPVALYVVRIGGDPRHFRYLIFPFCLSLCALGGVAEHLLRRFVPRHTAWWATVGGLLVALGSVSFYPPQLSGHPFSEGRDHETIDGINDSYPHRRAIRHEDWAPQTRGELQRHFRERRSSFAYDAIVDTWACVAGYRQYNKRIINNLGLTDPILARTRMPADRPAHKLGLQPLAKDLRRVLEETREPGRGTYRAAVERGIAADWIVRNLETIEVIERKVYNRHDFAENFGLAFAFPPQIEP